MMINDPSQQEIITITSEISPLDSSSILDRSKNFYSLNSTRLPLSISRISLEM
jgi:hypothetical protein